MNCFYCITQVLFIYVLKGYSLDFGITVPSKAQLAIHGHQVILGCSFRVISSWDLDSTVITWQRGQEVVHSFYYGQDQLDRQSKHFAHRTSLFHSEIMRGNASLRLARTNLGDRGDYTCSVSTLVGSQKKTFPLKIAAVYPEPHVNLKASPSGVVLQLTSSGGYPVATVQWLDDRGDDITNDTETRYSKDTQGLYTLFSSLSLPDNKSVTFLLQNKDLGEDIRREYTLQREIESSNGHYDRSRVCVAVSLLLLLMIVILLAVFFLKKKQCPHKRSTDDICTEKVNYSHANGESIPDMPV